MFTFLKEKNESENGEVVFQIPNNVIFQKTVRRRPGKEIQSLDDHLFKKILVKFPQSFNYNF
jgi:hypothetical protein